MKKDVHPKYGETEISCACGNTMQISSTAKTMHINVCSACHPFYTGKASLVDAAGRVEQFRKRYDRRPAS